MRKVLLALALTAVGLGLLLSFKSRPAAGTSALGGSALSGAGSNGVGTSSTTAPAPAPSSAPGSSSAPGASSSPSASAKAGAAAKTASGVRNGTFTGPAESTEYGPVQVQAVISGGRLTNVAVLQVPDRGGYEDQIVQTALPQLKSEALSAQSANIDIVSGATYTSQGYARSLQSALDQAGL